MSDQKYRQRGYKDDDRGEGRGGRSGRKQGPRPHREGPWGRGMGKPTANVFRCNACGGKVEPPSEGGIQPDTQCPHCEAPLHTCTNCRHFDPSARWQCREEPPRLVRSKTKANDCPLFATKQVAEFEQEKGGAREARAAFDALFDF